MDGNGHIVVIGVVYDHMLHLSAFWSRNIKVRHCLVWQFSVLPELAAVQDLSLSWFSQWSFQAQDTSS